jgi:hypothetical protein
VGLILADNDPRLTGFDFLRVIYLIVFFSTIGKVPGVTNGHLVVCDEHPFVKPDPKALFISAGSWAWIASPCGAEKR